MAQLNTRIVLRNDSTTKWLENSSTVLLKGEVGIEFLENGQVKIKIGDGVKPWDELSYFGGEESHVIEVTVENEETHLEAIARVNGDSSLSVGDIAIVKELIHSDKYQYTAYVYNGTTWAAMDGNYNAKNVYFDSDMLVTKEIGYITLTDGQGYIPSEGKNLVETFEAMFVKEANPKTTAPSVSWDSVTTGSFEVGTTVTPAWDAKFSAGSYTYGPANTGVIVTSWEISDTNGNTASTESGKFASFVVADTGTYKITAKANYTAGVIPVTNKGNEYSAGQIAAGSKSTTSSGVTGFRAFFYGVLDTDSASTPLTSAIVREQMVNGGAYNASKTFTLNGSSTAKRIIIAIPSSSTRAGLSEVILTSAMNTPVTDSYTKVEKAVQVEGVDGAVAVDYDIYVYEPSKIDAGEVHKITLA